MGIIYLFCHKEAGLYLYIKTIRKNLCIFLLVNLSGFVNIWTKGEKKTSRNQNDFSEVIQNSGGCASCHSRWGLSWLSALPRSATATCWHWGISATESTLGLHGKNPPFPPNVVIICWLEGSSVSAASFRSVKVTHPTSTCPPCYHRLIRELEHRVRSRKRPN